MHCNSAYEEYWVKKIGIGMLLRVSDKKLSKFQVKCLNGTFQDAHFAWEAVSLRERKMRKSYDNT